MGDYKASQQLRQPKQHESGTTYIFSEFSEFPVTRPLEGEAISFGVPLRPPQKVLSESTRPSTYVCKVEQWLADSLSRWNGWLCRGRVLARIREHEPEYRVHVGHLQSSPILKHLLLQKLKWVGSISCREKLPLIHHIEQRLAHKSGYQAGWGSTLAAINSSSISGSTKCFSSSNDSALWIIKLDCHFIQTLTLPVTMKSS